MFAANHPNVVPVHYAGTTLTDVCIAMPFYARGSLQTLLNAGPLGLKDTLRIGQEVLAGLAQVHRVGFVHLDVKPSNVLFDNQNVARVADFGQSRQVSSAGVVSSLPRMYGPCIPPEAFKTQVVTVTADVYQVGLLLYRIINGDADWGTQISTSMAAAGLRTDIERGRFPNRQRFLPHVPDRLRRVVRKALRKNPRERFQSATEFADALGRIAIDLDWQCSLQDPSKRSWYAARENQSNLVVVETRVAGRINVEVYTDGPQRRAKGRQDLWKRGLNEPDSNKHLETVFKRLA